MDKSDVRGLRMSHYFRVTCKNEPMDVPSDIFYEVIGNKVIKLIEIDRDGRHYWNSLDSYSSQLDIPGRDSLVEWKFDYLKLKESSDGKELWQEIQSEEFFSWYEQAKKIGHRRWEKGVGVYIVE
ncbi:MAG: hypothetical protein AAFR65_04645 [Pseudomonadota bacterium]